MVAASCWPPRSLSICASGCSLTGQGRLRGLCPHAVCGGSSQERRALHTDFCEWRPASPRPLQTLSKPRTPPIPQGVPCPAELVLSMVIRLEPASGRSPRRAPRRAPPDVRVWGPHRGLSHHSLLAGAQPRPTQMRKLIKGNLTKAQVRSLGSGSSHPLLLSSRTDPTGREAPPPPYCFPCSRTPCCAGRGELSSAPGNSPANETPVHFQLPV